MSCILDQFTQHFEKNLDAKNVDKLKKNLADRAIMNEMEQTIQVIAYNWQVFFSIRPFWICLSRNVSSNIK